MNIKKNFNSKIIEYILAGVIIVSCSSIIMISLNIPFTGNIFTKTHNKTVAANYLKEKYPKVSYKIDESGYEFKEGYYVIAHNDNGDYVTLLINKEEIIESNLIEEQ